MDYNKIYRQIIERAKNRKLEGYSENHHIVPRSLGGSNDKDNIVKLTAREHFLAHWLLFRAYPYDEKITYAFFMMSNRFKSFSSIAYQEARIAFSKVHSGRNVTQETKNKLSDYAKTRTGNKNSFYGKEHSKETKQKMSESAKRRNISEETEKLRREKISKSGKGIKRSEDFVRYMSESRKGENNPYIKYLKENGVEHHMKGKTYEKAECPHCKRMISVSIINVKHMNNCKFKNE